MDHLVIILLVYALFARTKAWFSPLQCDLERKEFWQLPLLLLIYF
jgi:hypothetical protein